MKSSLSHRYGTFLGMVSLILAMTGIVAGPGMPASGAPGEEPEIPTLEITGLDGPVDVVRDEWGIPTIIATTNHDLFMGYGYAMAQDRLWQMDGSRRLARGRVAEIGGIDQIHWDIYHRTFGLERTAMESLAVMDPVTYGFLQAFTDGVNAYINSYNCILGFEFIVMQYEPEQWDIVDSISIIKLVDVWLSADAWEEEMYGDLIAALGPERASQFFRPVPGSEPNYTPVSPQGLILGPMVFTGNAGGYAEISYGPMDDLRDRLINGLLEPLARMSANGHLEASNNWAVDGSLTESGEPILAMDPHLNYFAPSILYEAHLIGGDFNCWGSTFPGMPFIPFGANEHLAWGASNLPADCQDLFSETVNPENPLQYKVDDGWEDFEVITERIPYRAETGDQQIYLQNVYTTRHGPVIHQEYGKFLALKWTGSDPCDDVTPFANAMRASTLEEFYESFREYHSPPQNLCIAESGPDGRVGQVIIGQIPIRDGYDGTFPVDGSVSDYQWTGYIPYDSLPHRLDPPEGFVAHANNIPRGALSGEYPYMGSSFSTNHRVDRIIEMIIASAPISADEMRLMQMDDVDITARTVVPYILQAWDRSGGNFPGLEPYIATLSAWDYRLSMESTAATLYQLWVPKLAQSCMVDGQPYIMREYLAFEDRWFPILENYLAGVDGTGFPGAGDQAERDRIVLQALADTVERLKSQAGPDESCWAWGLLNQAVFPHPSGQSALIGGGSHPWGGGRYTVRVGHYSIISELPFANDFGAVMRAVASSVEGKWSIEAVLPPGEGGTAFGPHGLDQMDLWLAGELRDVQLNPDEMSVSSSYQLVPGTASGLPDGSDGEEP